MLTRIHVHETLCMPTHNIQNQKEIVSCMYMQYFTKYIVSDSVWEDLYLDASTVQ